MTPVVPADQYRVLLQDRPAPARYKVVGHKREFRYGPKATHWQVLHRGDWYRVWLSPRRLPHLYVMIHRRRIPVTLTRRRYL